jgi:CRISPR-associated protein Csm3
MEMILTDIKEIKGKLTLKSGLHIGAGDADMHIGGTDNPVVRHPHTQEPYIPGSSIKGKVRALLEIKSGLMGKTGGSPVQAKHLNGLEGDQKTECEKILKIFGSGGADNDDMLHLGPTRVSFADCALNDTWRQQAVKKRLNLFEVKSENTIDRIKGVAGSPRNTERVPAGAEFDFSVSLKVFGTEDDLQDYLLLGLKLLSMDALGGSGSRGYGRIEFIFDDKQIHQRFEEIKPF